MEPTDEPGTARVAGDRPATAIPTTLPTWRAVLLTADASPARSRRTAPIDAATTAGVINPSPEPHSTKAGTLGPATNSANPPAEHTSPAHIGPRGPRRPTARPAGEATSASVAKAGRHTSPAPTGDRPCTSCRNSVSTNSVPFDPRFIVAATAVAIANAGRRNSAIGSIGSAERRSTQRNAASSATAIAPAGHDRSISA
jgi:hypothetical protein